MRIQIRILDPHREKMDPDLNPDPDPGYFHKIYWIFFFNKAECSIFLSYFFRIFFLLKLNTIQKSGNFYNLSFFNSSDLGFESNFFGSFLLIFCPSDPDPRIGIFLRIRIQEAKILGIQRIRIKGAKYQQKLSIFTIYYKSWFYKVSSLWRTKHTHYRTDCTGFPLYEELSITHYRTDCTGFPLYQELSILTIEQIVQGFLSIKN